VKKQLFPGCEYKLRTAVHTLQNLVLEFHRKEALPSPPLHNTGDPNGERIRFTTWAGDIDLLELSNPCGFGPPRDVHRVVYSFGISCRIIGPCPLRNDLAVV
jgi:hypothetical protein